MGFGCLKNFYRLYFRIRSHCSNASAIVWTVGIINFLQQTVLLLDICAPRHMMSPKYGGRIWLYVRATLNACPWIFVTGNFLFDATVLLVLLILFTILLHWVARVADRHVYVPHGILVFIRLIQQGFCQIIIFPVSFRIAYSLEHLVKFEQDVLTIITVALYAVNVGLLTYHVFLTSVFLIPFTFVRESKLDMYDGRNFAVLYFIKCTVAVTAQVFAAMTQKTGKGVCVAILFFVGAFVHMIRTVTHVHVTILGQWMEIAPIVSAPIILLVRMFVTSWRFDMAIVSILYVVSALYLWMQQRILVRESLKIFKPFLHSERTPEEMPRFIPGAVVSMLRIVVEEIGSPEALMNFISVRRREGMKNSCMLEIIRFMALFPTRRAEAIAELKSISSNNSHNSFMAYLFRKTLEMMEEQLDAKDQRQLAILQRSYLVHSYLYWNARMVKNKWEVFKEACATAYFYRECIAYFESALQLAPFDTSLRAQFAEFSLSARGDYECYKREMTLVGQIESARWVIQDPMLHKVSTANPRILQYCTDDEMASSFSSTTTSSSGTRSSNTRSASSASRDSDLSRSIGLPFSDVARPQEPKKNGSAASLLKRSKKWIPMLAILHFVFPVLYFMVFVISAYPTEKNIRAHIDDLNASIRNIGNAYRKAASLVYVPYQVQIQPVRVEGDGCKAEIAKLPTILLAAYTKVQILREYTSAMIVAVNSLLGELFLRSDGLCDGLSKLSRELSVRTNVYSAELIKELGRNMNVSEQLVVKETRMYEYFSHVGVIVCVIVIILVVSFSVLYYQLNSITIQVPIEQIADIGLLSRFLFQKGEDAWGLLKVGTSYDSTGGDTGTKGSIEGKSSSHTNTGSSATPVFSSAATDSSVTTAGTTSSGSGSRKTVVEILGNSAFSVMDYDEFLSKTKRNLSSPSSAVSATSSAASMVTLSDCQDASAEDIIAEAEPEIDNIDSSDPADDPILQAIGTVKAEDKQSYLATLFTLIWPLVGFFIVFVACYVPVSARMDKRIQHAQNVTTVLRQMNSSMRLMLLVYQKAIGNQTMYEKFTRQMDDDIKRPNNEMSQFYMKEQCFTLEEKVCGSIGRMIIEAIETNVTQAKVATVHLPLCIQLVATFLNIGITEKLQALNAEQPSNGPSFLALAGILCVAFIIYGIYETMILSDGFNSLFHCPYEDNKKPKETRRIQITTLAEHLPSNAIIVTILAGTGEIYSVTENSRLIIKRSAVDLIGSTFSDVFTITDRTNCLLEHVLPDKKTKMVFRYKSEEMGKLMKMVLVEEKNVGDARQTDMKRNAIMKLINFLPIDYAKHFAENGKRDFHHTNAFMILVRLAPGLSTIRMDKLFNTTNMLTQNYNNVHLFDMDGDTISLISDEEAGPVIPMLFIRDVLSECQGSGRGAAAEVPVCSFLVCFMSHLHLSIPDISEPYLKIDCDNLPALHFMLHQLPKDTICFDCSTRERLPRITEKTEPFVVRLNPAGEEVETSIMKFSSLTTEYAMSLQFK